MTTERLTWQEIEERFDREWVELVDYDWPEGDHSPKGGVVRTHSANKKEFYRLANQEPVPPDSAILFVGKKGFLEDNVIFSPNLSRITICAK